MDIKLFLTVFATVLLAELGDKTQLATLLFAAKEGSRLWLIFAAASIALMVATAIGVAAGALLSEVLEPRWLSYIAGSGFILIGAWTLWQA